MVGMAGSGGSAALGRGGIVGKVGAEGVVACKSWRAARLIWRLGSNNAMIKETASMFDVLNSRTE
ncbi:hypothetical protein RJ639_004056 [Escallonia herrerae]|uniref:Uncharacterized protein n=1 Tax=Escallonia herrerae TaxID=1293975 RepID=A0AA88W1S6_9ASTE|nr:hypothetical protein RJ639_004056 [Escallonia herrerae]